MVAVAVTPSVKEILHALHGSDKLSAAEKKDIGLGKADEFAQIELSQLELAAQLYRERIKDGKSGPWLHELIQGSSLILPDEFNPQSWPKKVKNPELEERLKKLRAAQEAREYAAMVHNLTAEQRRQADRDQVSTYSGQLSIGANVIVALITAFTFGYFVGKQMFHGTAPAVVLGTLCGTAALLIETVLFVTRASTLDKLTDKRLRSSKTQGSFPAVYRPISLDASGIDRRAGRPAPS